MKDKPKTAQQWLALPEAERGVALAEALTPMGTKHKFGKSFSGWKGRLKRCQHCGKTFPAHTKQNKCVPDPLVIDWNTAMEWFRKVPLLDIIVVLAQVSNAATDGEDWREDEGGEVNLWFLIFAQPYHYLVAAAMAQDK